MQSPLRRLGRTFDDRMPARPIRCLSWLDLSGQRHVGGKWPPAGGCVAGAMPLSGCDAGRLRPSRRSVPKARRSSCRGPSRPRREVRLTRHLPVKAGVGGSAIVKVEIPADRFASLYNAIVAMPTNLFVFGRLPDPFDKDVVAPRAIAVLGDGSRVESSVLVKPVSVSWLL